MNASASSSRVPTSEAVVPASSSWVPTSEDAIVSSALPSPQDSAGLPQNTSLEVEITDLFVDTTSDPQQGFEPIRTADIDEEWELVDGLEFGVPVEVDWSFKRLRRIAEVFSPPLTS